ncbi:MAG: hypothetical protein ACPLXC_00975 [Candidatus Pacearchaeota archaeon]
MENRALLKLSLVIALVSIFIITILATNLEPPVRKIATINERSLDEWVKIQGEVTQQKEYENLKIITVHDDTASINCVLRFDTEPLENRTVEILGKVIDYKGDFEIDVSRLFIIK